MSEEQPILVEEKGDIAVVTMNRPDRKNAMNQVLIRDLADALKGLSGWDAPARVIIITGAGDAYSSGGDVEMFTGPGKAQLSGGTSGGLPAVFDAVLSAPQVVISAVHGACVGGALVMAGCSDFRVCSTEAFFMFPEVKIGMVPAIGVARINHTMPDRMMRTMMLTGDRYPADRAYEDGFIDELVAPDKLMDTAYEVAERVLKNPREAVMMCKKVARSARGPDVRLSLDYEWELNRSLRYSGETEELSKAFLGKKK